jgi:DNA-3-methyladenine glycosylase II
MERLHGVARAALAGRLEPGYLAGLDTGTAMAELQAIRGLGRTFAGLVYLRSSGVTDALTLSEPRLPSYLQHYYQLEEPPDAAAIERVAEPWRPFRTWAGVLIRVAGDRDRLPSGPPAPRRLAVRQPVCSSLRSGP